MPSVKTEERRDIDVINEIVLNGNKTKQLQCCLLPSNQRQKRGGCSGEEKAGFLAF